MTTLDLQVASAIEAKLCGLDGNFSVELEIEKDDIYNVVTATGAYSFDGYEETGGFFLTNADVSIEDCTITAYNEDNEEVECNIDINTFAIERYLCEVP